MPASLDAEVAAFAILFARIGAVLMLLPAFGDEALPGRIRLLLAVGTTLALFPMLRPLAEPLLAGGDAGLLRILPVELLVGLAMGSLVRIIFLAAAMAGALISVQAGLTTSLVFDPAAGSHTPTLGKLVVLAATLFCLSTGLHHLWFEALLGSYAAFPPGQVPDEASWLQLAVATTAQATRLACELAAPFLIYGIVFNVVLGFSTRLAPAIQIFFIAQPLNIMLGIGLLAVTGGTILVHFADGLGAWLSGGWTLV